MDWDYILCVLGMVLVIEGLPWFAFPNRIKIWIIQILEIPEGNLRLFGFLSMALGIILVYMGRH